VAQDVVRVTPYLTAQAPGAVHLPSGKLRRQIEGKQTSFYRVCVPLTPTSTLKFQVCTDP
jgi:hypothetical protein